MNIMEMVAERYCGTDIEAISQTAFGTNCNYDLDCNNGGDDCSIEQYES